ncbi:hypothetical protein KC19_N021500 [Ceratodon purpureus]|nr:hypothetical protein KC19_N021500 [Ceratodon purpureus]
MLHSVRGEPSRLDMVPGDVEDLDRAVSDMDNVLTAGLFQASFKSILAGALA